VNAIGRWLVLLCAMVVAGCESPAVPFDSGQYDYRLLVPGGGSRTFHWDLGADVPVYIDSEVAGRPSLSDALDAAGSIWTPAALFGEVRLRQTTNLDEAVAVLQWKDAEPILSTPPGCSGSSTGAAFTRGCLNEGADSLRTWLRRDGGPSQVIFTVFVENRPDLDADLLRLLVTHEAGHVLGILSHSNDQDDLMWGGILSTDQPSLADRQTLRSLYQAPVDLLY
jgi:hypothetical protein